MKPFDYAVRGYSVPEAVARSHRAVWQRLAAPGSWWSGAQRVEMARLCRVARAQRTDPPWLRDGTAASSEVLPPRAADALRRIAADVHSIDSAWADETTRALGDAAYVELCAVSVCVTSIDAFAEALGIPPEPLPEPLAGEPDRLRPAGTADAGAFVAMTHPFPGPNVARALGLAPGDNQAFFGLMASMYATADFTEMVWKDRPLTRPQVELLAARVSAVNECFY